MGVVKSNKQSYIMEVKELYVAPVAEKLELTNEGIVCLSPGPYPEIPEEDI